MGVKARPCLSATQGSREQSQHSRSERGRGRVACVPVGRGAPCLHRRSARGLSAPRRRGVHVEHARSALAHQEDLSRPAPRMPRRAAEHTPQPLESAEGLECPGSAAER